MTPGLNGVFVGPADLALGLYGGKLGPAADREEPEMLDAIHRIVDAAHQGGIHAAIFCASPAYAARAVAWGYDLVTINNDVRLLAAAAHASVAETRRLLAD